MTFRLLYRGRLPANGSPKEKHSIRRQLHPQLAELWRQPPLKDRAEQREFFNQVPSGPGKISLVFKRGTFTFVPLVTTRLALVCHLDILFLRPGTPGAVIQHGGDLDNRLKTLFDALQVPDMNQLRDENPGPGETPFFCLLEDDALITRVSVETDRLLEASETGGAADPSRVSLVLAVRLEVTEVLYANIGLA